MRAPCDARSTAMARPMPVVPPVTSTRLPWRFVASVASAIQRLPVSASSRGRGFRCAPSLPDNDVTAAAADDEFKPAFATHSFRRLSPFGIALPELQFGQRAALGQNDQAELVFLAPGHAQRDLAS